MSPSANRGEEVTATKAEIPRALRRRGDILQRLTEKRNHLTTRNEMKQQRHDTREKKKYNVESAAILENLQAPKRTDETRKAESQTVEPLRKGEGTAPAPERERIDGFDPGADVEAER